MNAFADDARVLAGGSEGAAALRSLTGVVFDALEAGAARRGGPLPSGGPAAVAERVRAVLGESRGGRAAGVLPEEGTGAVEALSSLVGLAAEGAADPADPLCAAHLHCPPLAVAAAADLSASVLNPSMDSWDQAPAASELEASVCRALAGLLYGGGRGGVDGGPDALVTTGGTESNQLGVLLAREASGPGVRVVCGVNAHHSVPRAAWLLGLPEPVRVAAPRGVLEPAGLRAALESLGTRAPGAPVLVVATAGTTDTGAIDPLDELADVVREFDVRSRSGGGGGVRLHVDAAYGGMLLFSSGLRARLSGLERADSVTLDLHKLGWQPVAAGLFVVPDGRALRPLDHRADYLNADDDTAAGLPDLLGRSLRTTRRPDVLKVAVTLRALGRAGVGALVERTCGVASRLAALVDADPRLELFGPPVLSTVLFRPVGADAESVAAVRRRLLAEGRAVLGRAAVSREDGAEEGAGGCGELWLKATLLNPHAGEGDLRALLGLVIEALPSAAREAAWPEPAAPARPLPASRSGTPPPPHVPAAPVPRPASSAPAGTANVITSVTASSAARSPRS
ncbi:L-2,4-diaminobutyrate decarboxylase [Streptomyces sp. WMMB 714]|uniref:pyridoxal phosphate-dependent decarboxylase family protein n=1 Tax=Streptomyces sp. WMMB 714 TaxID=1286822 RepID=UPI00082384B8|nr:pyridoxal-dependent decarboxylase [Streptomyces sp. WMMB 714]SCK29342.1 L-2,4-diaminobutyrate decarboxylase [Streptomyces sp. WMMB 714]